MPISDYFGEPDNPDVSADPPRVWIKGQTFPGCSYTRSLGDAVAKQMGILATPEVTNHRLTPQVRASAAAALGARLPQLLVLKLCVLLTRTHTHAHTERRVSVRPLSVQLPCRSCSAWHTPSWAPTRARRAPEGRRRDLWGVVCSRACKSVQLQLH